MKICPASSATTAACRATLRRSIADPLALELKATSESGAVEAVLGPLVAHRRKDQKQFVGRVKGPAQRPCGSAFYAQPHNRASGATKPGLAQP